MEKSNDFVGLVQQAQLGDKECLSRLAEVVRDPLYAYIYRYTLSDDLTNDIVQESIVTMLEAIKKLREVGQFWPWLRKIALNNMHNYHRNEEKRRKNTPAPENQSPEHNDSREAIAGMIYQEFKEDVFAAIGALTPEHRTVINMRCYDQMPFSEIAKMMSCSEYAAQKLFYRAKNSLKKQLVRRGFGRGSLLTALVLFGKLTAADKAAAASLSVTPAALKGQYADKSDICSDKQNSDYGIGRSRHYRCRGSGGETAGKHKTFSPGIASS